MEALNAIPWSQLGIFASGILVLIIILVFVLRVLPTWERVKLADNKTREVEATALGGVANALTNLAASQSQLTTVLSNIAIEQRQQIESVKILQRVNASSNEQLTDVVSVLTDKVQRLEEKENESRPIHKT